MPKIWEKYFKIYNTYSSWLQMNSFYLNFFIFSKKKLLRNIRSCSEYLTLFTVYRMFTLRNLVSIIMKARAYLMYKILTRSRDDSGSWPKDIFCKRYIVSLCPRLRYVLYRNECITDAIICSFNLHNLKFKLSEFKIGLWRSKKLWKHFKNDKNALYFTLKALFVLKIFNFLSWLFGHVEQTARLER